MQLSPLAGGFFDVDTTWCWWPMEKRRAKLFHRVHKLCGFVGPHTQRDLEVWSQYLCLCLHHTVHGPHHGPVVRVSARLGACF